MANHDEIARIQGFWTQLQYYSMEAWSPGTTRSFFLCQPLASIQSTVLDRDPHSLPLWTSPSSGAYVVIEFNIMGLSWYIYGLLKSKSIHLEGNRRDPHYQVCYQFPFRVAVMDTAKANIFLLSVTSSRRHGLKSELGSKPQHLSNKMRSGYISNYHLNGWMNGWVLLFVVCTMKCLVVVYKLQPAKYSSFISSQRSLTIWV